MFKSHGKYWKPCQLSASSFRCLNAFNILVLCAQLRIWETVSDPNHRIELSIVYTLQHNRYSTVSFKRNGKRKHWGTTKNLQISALDSMIWSVQICKFTYVADSAEQGGKHTVFIDTQVLSCKKNFLTMDVIALLMVFPRQPHLWQSHSALTESRTNPISFIAAFSFYAPLGQLIRMAFMPNTLLLCSQPSSTKATTHCTLSLLSQSLPSELISFGDNSRQRRKKKQKVMLQLRTNRKTLPPELIPGCFYFHLFCVTCCHAWVTWHRVFSCLRYKESIFHCAEAAQKPAHFLTEYSIQTLKKREKTAPS